MRTKIFLSLFFLLVLLTANLGKAAEVKSVLPIEHWTTKNGVPVYFVAKSQIPIVDIGIVFRAGTAYDGALSGIAQFTAQMLEQGTRNLSTDQIANRFESVGAHYNPSINQDMAILNLRSLSNPQFFNSSFNTFSDIVSHASFPQLAIDRLKKQIKTAIQQEAQTPSAIAGNAFYKTLYGRHAYALPLLGTTQDIEQITQINLVNFYQQYYVSKNAVIAIVGNVTKAKAVSLAEQLANALPQGKKAILLPANPAPQLTTYLSKIPYPAQQTTVLLGQIGISLHNADYFPLIVGNQILGGGILTSRLFNEVRNKRGLCYGISSGFNTLEAGGPFIIGLQTRKTQSSAALSVTRSTLKNFITKGPSKEELDSAKQALIASFPLTVANNAAILGNLEKIGFYTLPLNYLDSYQEKLNNVTVDQVQNAFQKHIRPEKLLIIMVGEN